MYNDEIYHFGVKGMKWGVRRYQNSDGTLTAAGKKRRRTVGPVGRTIGKTTASIHKGIAKYHEKKASSIDKDLRSLQENKTKLTSLHGHKGQKLFSDKDIEEMINSLENVKVSEIKKSKKHERFANTLLKQIEDIKIRDL